MNFDYKNFCFFIFLLLSVGYSGEITYSVPEKPWAESFGNHRAILSVNEKTDAVYLNIDWRRHDRDPSEKRFLIVNAISGDTVRNSHRIQVNNERCKIVFGPVEMGEYYFYYLPYVVQPGWGAYRQAYLKPDHPPDKKWLAMLTTRKGDDLSDLPHALCIEIQSRTEFDSFYPMEIIATESEKQEIIANSGSSYLLFPEDRRFPVRMFDTIPQRWIKKGNSDSYSAKALQNEYFVFQVGFFAVQKGFTNIKIRFSDFKSPSGNIIPAKNITCFNTDGIDPYGNAFTKEINVGKGMVQAFWIGVDIPKTVQPDLYKGEVEIKPTNAASQKIMVSLKIVDEVLTDRGDGELWRHSRLRWLNSTTGIDDNPVLPYKAIKRIDPHLFQVLGREIGFAESGLPQTIISKQIPILSSEISFIVETKNKGKYRVGGRGELISHNENKIKLKSNWDNEHIRTEIKTVLESDGHLNFKIDLQVKEDLNIRDIRLEIPM